jgi:hypothetical protein
MFVTNCYNGMTITRDAMTLHWTLAPSLPPLSVANYHYQRGSSCTHACTAEGMEIQQVERWCTATNKFKGNCYSFAEWDEVTSCRLFNLMNALLPRRVVVDMDVLSLRLYTHTISFLQLKRHPSLQFQSCTRQARLQNNHCLRIPTFCGVDNTSKHSIQFSAVQMLSARCSAMKCEQKKLSKRISSHHAPSKRISSHHAPDWGKSY